MSAVLVFVIHSFQDTFLSKNHHYQFEILEEDDETVQIMLCQKDQRIYDLQNITIGFSVFKVCYNQSEASIAVT